MAARIGLFDILQHQIREVLLQQMGSEQNKIDLLLQQQIRYSTGQATLIFPKMLATFSQRRY